MTDKILDWRIRYDTLIAEARSTSFKWFSHDCVMFAAKALDAQYDIGLIPYIEENYRYSNESEATEVIEKAGGLVALVTEVLGVSTSPPLHLTTGDIALYEYGYNNFPFALAVHDGHQLLAPAQEGLTYLHLTRALKGWKL